MTTVFTLNPTQAHYAIMMLEFTLAEHKKSLDTVYSLIRRIKFWSKLRDIETANADLLALKTHLNEHGYYFVYRDLDSFWNGETEAEIVEKDALEADYVRSMWEPTASVSVELTALQANAVAATMLNDSTLTLLNWLDRIEGNGALDPTTPSEYVKQFQERLELQGFSFYNFYHVKYSHIAHKREKK